MDREFSKRWDTYWWFFIGFVGIVSVVYSCWIAPPVKKAVVEKPVETFIGQEVNIGLLRGVVVDQEGTKFLVLLYASTNVVRVDQNAVKKP